MFKSSSKSLFIIITALAFQFELAPALSPQLQISPALAGTTAAGNTGYMQPIKKDGKYYYSAQDNHKHIDLFKALSTLKRKMLSPTLFSPSAWATSVTSFFYPKPAEPKSDPIKFLNPTQSIPESNPAQPTITWIGHATFLIQLDGFNILTDPVFGHVKVGPFNLSKRGMPAGIKFEDLPHIDAVVISHNHSDHMDTPALMALNKKFKPTIFVPVGNRKTLAAMGFKNNQIVENTWWEQNTLTKNSAQASNSQDTRSIIITCLPAYHWSIRFDLGSYRESLWSSWLISSDSSSSASIYFAGDTAYGPHFKEIGHCFPNINIALMPIGPTEKGENRHKESHVDALEAVDAFIDLGAHCFVPMHYGTFFISPSTVELPINRLHAHWQEKLDFVGSKKLLVARCGQQYSF
jgi:L-ascorbate metabolism protein UlaG (beta-lactamase superfamily)